MERKWWTLIAVCVATFMLLLDITVVNVALPDIQKDLNASLSSLQWVVDAYSLTLAAFLLTAGSFAGPDRPGVPGTRARHRDRRLGRDDRGCGGGGPPGRRRAHRGARLGVDLL